MSRKDDEIGKLRDLVHEQERDQNRLVKERSDKEKMKLEKENEQLQVKNQRLLADIEENKQMRTEFGRAIQENSELRATNTKLEQIVSRIKRERNEALNLVESLKVTMKHMYESTKFKIGMFTEEVAEEMKGWFRVTKAGIDQERKEKSWIADTSNDLKELIVNDQKKIKRTRKRDDLIWQQGL